MSQLISYAQNNEDVVLHRALRHVDGGFYIDVGACDPTYDSVTKLFYDRGWSGINVEPSTPMYDRLVLNRPRDNNLNVALSEHAGELTFYRIGETGLSTLDASAAEKARSEGQTVEETRTEVRTLAEVCRATRVGDVHFLKIDVEGAERQVLSGADFAAVRPWIIVVEATAPGTSARVDDQWRFLLEQAGYEPVLFDGLNLFFLAGEHPELRASLVAPANVFDGFIPIRHHAALLRLGSTLGEGRGGEERLIDGSPESLHDLVAWHEAVARESLERETADRIAWNRADAEAGVRRSMEETVAWNRADAEAGVLRSMEQTIAWNRADAEASLRRSIEETIAWHRADAAEHAFRRGMETVDQRLRDTIREGIEAERAAKEEAAALRRLLTDQTARHSASEIEFHDVHLRHDRDVARLREEHDQLLAWRDAVVTSTSWRLTRPLRFAARWLKRVFA